MILSRTLRVEPVPDWVLSGSVEKKRKRVEDGGEGEVQTTSRGRPRRVAARQQDNAPSDVDENQNERTVESDSGQSDFEDNLKKKLSRMSSSASNGGGGGGDDFVEAKIPTDILAKVLPLATKEGLTVRQAVMMVSGVLVGSGVNLEDFVISTSTCQRVLTEQCGVIGSEALDKFAEDIKQGDEKVFCHFDGKLMEEDFKGKRQSNHRLVSLLSSPSHAGEQLLGVAPLEKESGYAIALEVYGQLLGLGCESHVAGAVFDSTAVNTGSEDGAGIHLQRLLERPILEIECGHHVQVQKQCSLFLALD